MSAGRTRQRAAAALPPFGERIVAWQRAHGRHDLPWQGSTDIYRVWLSEVMLQQTQVATVLAYFDRFLTRFPTLAHLAAAPLDDVLALWSGLGYYSRARNLHRCARAVAALPGGQFPQGAQALAQLPGIGRSTAAALAVFCQGERGAILDGNVKRVLSRHLGFEGDLATVKAERELWQHAERLLPATGLTAYTQGLMDLGAGVCVRRPDCGACPVAEDCVAREQGRQAEYPVKLRKLKRGSRSNTLLWLEWGGRLCLVQRPEQGVWAGLWTLPVIDDLAALQALLPPPAQRETLPPIAHALTHFDWHLAPLRVGFTARQGRRAEALAAAAAGNQAWRWCTVDEALALGLPAPVRRWLESDR